MLRKEEGPGAPKGSKLQAVFAKLAGVLPRAQEIGSTKTTAAAMASNIIESVLAEADSPLAPPRKCEPVAPCLTVSALAHRLEMDLRAAKRTHLACGEVLLPCGLLQRISRDIVTLGESEPYGVRGCLIYVNFEALDVCRKLSSVKCDTGTATTFELNLTLRQNATGWNFIPQFIKNLGRGGTIVVSSAYVLSKKKLYRSNLE